MQSFIFAFFSFSGPKLSPYLKALGIVDQYTLIIQFCSSTIFKKT